MSAGERLKRLERSASRHRELVRFAAAHRALTPAALARWARAGRLYVAPSVFSPSWLVPSSSTYSSYELRETDGQKFLLSTELNELLASSRTPLTKASAPYRLPPSMRPWAPFVIAERERGSGTLFNGTNVGLRSDLDPEAMVAGRAIELGQTDYFSGLCTNELCGKEVRSRRTRKALIDGSRLCRRQGQISTLAHSDCANILGVSTLALTSDRHLVLTRQGSGSAVSSGRLAPSGSGSIDWADLDATIASFEALARRGMERELSEEIGVAPERILTTELTGFARLLDRGAKPEMFGVSLIDSPAAELQISEAERGLIDELIPVRLEGEGLGEVEELLPKLCRSSPASLSFLVCFELLKARVAARGGLGALIESLRCS